MLFLSWRDLAWAIFCFLADHLSISRDSDFSLQLRQSPDRACERLVLYPVSTFIDKEF